MLLSKHQEIQEKLRADLLGMKVDERSKSAYMRNVVMESNRLLPVTPLGTVRKIGRDITCKNEYGPMIIPKDSVMYIPLMLLHRNPSVFERPKEFLPERWENATKKMRESMMTFSLGQVRIDLILSFLFNSFIVAIWTGPILHLLHFIRNYTAQLSWPVAWIGRIALHDPKASCWLQI